MTAYLARRLLQAIAVVLLVTLIVFGLLRLAPGGAAADVLGTGSAHQQFLLQYLTWLGRVLHGNLGYSRARNESVTYLLAASLPRTLALTGISTLIALVVAIPVGLLQAVRRSRAADHVLRGLTYLFYGMPTFVLGAVLVLFFAVDKHIFGAEGPQAPGIVGVITDVRDLTLPVLTLTLVTIAIFARYMRSSALDSLAQEYVEAARARGAGQRRVLDRARAAQLPGPGRDAGRAQLPADRRRRGGRREPLQHPGHGLADLAGRAEPRLRGDAGLHAGDRHRRGDRVAAGRHRLRRA